MMKNSIAAVAASLTLFGVVGAVSAGMASAAPDASRTFSSDSDCESYLRSINETHWYTCYKIKPGVHGITGKTRPA